MSEAMTAVSALNGKTVSGFCTVAEGGLQGMITLRADFGSKALADALEWLGLSLPEPRKVVTKGAKSVLWMSPDELLILVPYADAVSVAHAMETSLKGEHFLVANVSEARSIFTVTGARAAEVVMKISPIDFGTMARDEVRRTRTAQTAAAVWWSGDEQLSLVCFRSYATYVMGLLEVSARPGGELF
ncbi:sarcosine oxidase subunit gamma family protein [Thioclava litoralis]|uniref:Sarcosine oxidase subunit gamma family protein n=1 Tax=Thioclava litoralis TaxID=3076557 RepID=A0ABZ1DZY1_9RHOB|nr:sarcosine oxidase subunit gamma family protein [Thioclava sp. FTW29]